MGNSHFHSADELENELLLGGFSFTKVHGVIGGAWLVPNIDELWKDEKSKKAIMNTVRLLDGKKDIIGLSTRIIGISKKNCLIAW